MKKILVLALIVLAIMPVFAAAKCNGSEEMTILGLGNGKQVLVTRMRPWMCCPFLRCIMKYVCCWWGYPIK